MQAQKYFQVTKEIKYRTAQGYMRTGFLPQEVFFQFDDLTLTDNEELANHTAQQMSQRFPNNKFSVGVVYK